MEGQGAVGRAYLPVALLDLADPPSEPSLNETMDAIKDQEVRARIKCKASYIHAPPLALRGSFAHGMRRDNNTPAYKNFYKTGSVSFIIIFTSSNPGKPVRSRDVVRRYSIAGYCSEGITIRERLGA